MLDLLLLALAIIPNQDEAPAPVPATAGVKAERLPPTPWPVLAFEADQTDWDGLIDRIGQGALDDLDVPGLTIAVSLGDDVVFERGYGFANLEHEVPAGPETIYRIGSVTKQFTAAAIMGLVEEGELALEDDARDHLPWFDTDGRRVSVRQLLTHTSGVPSYTDLGLEWMAKLHQDVTPEEIFGWVSEVPFDFEPGTDWHYSNTGYILLGALIKEVGRRSPRTQLRRTVTKGLGLASIDYDNYREVIPHRAAGYDPGLRGPINAQFISMTQPGAAGAIIATAGDLLRWQRALVSGQVISQHSYAQMTAPAFLPDGRSTGYGFGLSVGRLNGLRRISHGGGIMGFSSALAWYPEVELGVCVLTNRSGVDATGIERSVTRNVLGMLRPLDIDLPVDADQRAALVGRYAFLSFELEVSEVDGELLRTVVGSDTVPRRLVHRGDLAFGLDEDPDLLIRFQAGPDGRIATAVVEEDGNELVGVRR
ncbi:serine hydrolase domain-containing protein [Engelhardtia mirabilis]|uniref:Penicillin-binding protein 4 n=1 Tax=Engelhardtia mirabilis TaxID=2528011 RepID=A0A518BP14_9BACT|nr:Penicillin-binding protein 4* [Planctomycetes bacterium Pla133]QDV03044.1 Penicillin-binding protein 4* [Planctomycetes bacterium Pla86]